jgi:hypothetical protein
MKDRQCKSEQQQALWFLWRRSSPICLRNEGQDEEKMDVGERVYTEKQKGARV